MTVASWIEHPAARLEAAFRVIATGWSTSLPAMVTTRSNAASVPVYRIEMGVPVLS